MHDGEAPLPGLVAGVTALLIEQYPQLQRGLAWVPVGLVGFVAVAKAVRQILDQPPAGLGWVTADRWIDVVAWAAVALAVTVALANSDRRPLPRILRFPDGDTTSPVEMCAPAGLTIPCPDTTWEPGLRDGQTMRRSVLAAPWRSTWYCSKTQGPPARGTIAERSTVATVTLPSTRSGRPGP